MYIVLHTQVGTLANGRYQGEVTLVRYNNPNGTCQDCAINTAGSRSCCDDFDRFSMRNGDTRCDPYFTYCLRPLGSTGGGVVLTTEM